jgi:hypothetical protein
MSDGIHGEARGTGSWDLSPQEVEMPPAKPTFFTQHSGFTILSE